MKSTRLDGLIAAPYTPFKPDFSLNTELVPRLAEHLVQQRVSGAFIAGTTGESLSLTSAERIRLAESWRHAADSRLKLIVHVGHNSVADCCELAEHAESIAADAIAAVMPSFFRPETEEAVVEFCRQIAAAAPATPFYYYHIPSMTGVNFNMADMLPRFVRRIPTFRGIKFTHSNLMDFSLTLAEAGPDYDILFGRDEILLAGLAVGACGAVGSTYNYSATLFHQLMEAYASGDLPAARAQQIAIQKTILPLLQYGPIPAGKAIMAMIGLDCGMPRPPLIPIEGARLASLQAELERSGLFRALSVQAHGGE